MAALTIGGIFTSLVALISIGMGILLFTEIPKQYGLYRWYAQNINHMFIGFTPAHFYNVPYGFTADELYTIDLTGQTAIVTGANAGIGYEISKSLYTLGVDVTMACRNIKKCNEAADRIRNSVDASTVKKSKTNTITTMILDTNSLASVLDFSISYKQTHHSLDMLYLNAGSVGYIDKVNKKCVPTNADNIEMTFATNYVGHHLLFRYMQPLLEQATSSIARVISTSSNASYQSYTYLVATNRTTLNGCIEPYTNGGVSYSYGQSKLAQILWTKYVAAHFLSPSSKIYINAFHPGIVATEIFDKALSMSEAPNFILTISNWFMKNVYWTPFEGALTGLFLGTNTKALVESNIRGKYYHPQSVPINDHPHANDLLLQEQLWNFTEELVKDYLPTTSVQEE